MVEMHYQSVSAAAWYFKRPSVQGMHEYVGTYDLRPGVVSEYFGIAFYGIRA